MRLYLDSNVAHFGSSAEAKGFKLTHYVDGLTNEIIYQIKDWENLLQNRLEADEKSLLRDAQKLIQYVHSATECIWKRYHCFIGIQNAHAVLYFIPMQTHETPYKTSGWHEYNSSSGVDILRIHLAYSVDDSKRYAVYINKVIKHFENVRLFLWCDISTSSKALEILAYVTALRLGNYRELESDCLEFAKAAAKSAKQNFATEGELRVVVDIDSLTVTNYKGEALSRRNLAVRFAVFIFRASIQQVQMAYVPVVVTMFYHFFIR